MWDLHLRHSSKGFLLAGLQRAMRPRHVSRLVRVMGSTRQAYELDLCNVLDVTDTLPGPLSYSDAPWHPAVVQSSAKVRSW
jgi:hypothetical protein